MQKIPLKVCKTIENATDISFFKKSGITTNTFGTKRIEVANQLANYPTPCPHCNKSLWRFDMSMHVKKYPRKECPDEGFVSKAGSGILRTKRFRLKTASKLLHLIERCD